MSYFKDFLAGKKGWSHSAQEFGVWALCIGLTGWLISPILSGVIAIVFYFFSEKYKIPFVGDRYWISCEVKQSFEMGREVTNVSDVYYPPKEPNGFWTQDAIDDVKFPSKARNVWLGLSIVYSVAVFSQIGFLAGWIG